MIVVEIENSHFKVGKQTLLFIDNNTSPQNTQPGLNIYALAVIDGFFYHYDIHDDTLHKYSLQYLVGDRQKELKYLLRVAKVYR